MCGNGRAARAPRAFGAWWTRGGELATPGRGAPLSAGDLGQAAALVGTHLPVCSMPGLGCWTRRSLPVLSFSYLNCVLLTAGGPVTMALAKPALRIDPGPSSPAVKANFPK